MDKVLRGHPFEASNILVTGATGYLGALIVSSLLRNTAAHITCLTRPTHDLSSLLTPIIEEWEASGRAWSAQVERRIGLVHLPDDPVDLVDLAPTLQGVDEIIHCAGCLDYYDTVELQAVNVHFTAHLLVLARQLAVTRFVYISTAYSSGYQDWATPEARLTEPPSDPTEYTRTKRHAEHLVARSGVPFIVIRPSILIGTSDTGRYSGRRYGLYQQWMGLERLACDRYHAEFHTVAPDMPLNLLHQDAFCSAFVAAYAWLPNGAFMNLVSNPHTSPTMRDLWGMWFELTRPATIYYYPSIDDVPLNAIHTRQRAYLSFAQVNLQIASHHWRFETTWLELLRAKGLQFTDATIDTVRICHDRFVTSSELIARYLSRHASDLAVHPKVVEVARARSSARQEAAILEGETS